MIGAKYLGLNLSRLSVVLLLAFISQISVHAAQQAFPAQRGWLNADSFGNQHFFTAPQALGAQVCANHGWGYEGVTVEGELLRFTCLDEGGNSTSVPRHLAYPVVGRAWCFNRGRLQGRLCVIGNGEENPEKPNNCPTAGNPINPNTGVKFQREVDYEGTGPYPLKFERLYITRNMGEVGANLSGIHWRTTYSAFIESNDNELDSTRICNDPKVAIVQPSAQYLATSNYNRLASCKSDALRFTYVHRNNGSTTYYVLNENDQWVPDSDQTATLTNWVESGDRQGFIYTTPDNTKEYYNTDGELIRTTNRQGLSHHYTYDPTTHVLMQVADDFGRTLQFTYETYVFSPLGENTIDTTLLQTRYRIKTLIDPDGGVYQYTYDNNNNLAQVDNPDNTTRVYHYEDVDLPNALTGITDENNNRFATWRYDDMGRVIVSEHADNTNRTTFTYELGRTRVVDAQGLETVYRFDAAILGVKKPIQIDQPCSQCSGLNNQTTYDANGFVSSRTDFNGNVTQFIMDARGLEQSRVEAAGTPAARTIQTEWHADLRLPVRIIEPNKTTEFEYDNQGNLEKRTEIDTTVSPNVERVTRFTYDNNGLLLSINGPRTDVSDTTTFEYDAQGNRIRSTNAKGHVTLINSHDAHGNPLSITDVNGVNTTLTYDARQRLLSRTVAAGTSEAATTTFEYDGVGNISKLIQADGSFLEYTYDDAQRLIEINDNQNNRMSYTLDNSGNRIQEDTKDPNGILTRQQRQVFNQLSRLTQSIGAQNQTTIFTYDANGNQIQMTDALNRNTTQSFDALNRLIQITDPLNGLTQYNYDAQDNLTQVIDPTGLSTNYTYNGFNELIEQTSPDTGTTTYIYDKAGNRISQTDARGITSHFEYDALNRLIEIDYQDDSLDITYTYDASTNGVGRLSRVEDASGTTDYTYDARGNHIAENKTINGLSFILAYSYDAADRLTQITYPSDRVVTYTYNNIGQITDVTTSFEGQSQTIAQAIDYLPFGPMMLMDYGNNLSATHTYDQDYRLTDQNIPGIQQLNYSYDAINNINAITNNLDVSRNQSFNYDSLDRLTSAQGIYGNQTYSYDAIGNRIGRNDDGNQQTYQYDSQSHRLLSITGDTTHSFQYDANGNTIQKDGFNFTYDEQNRLAQVTGATPAVTYTYNAQGQRVIKQRSGETTIYHYDPNGLLIAESDSLGNTQQEYLYVNGQRLAMTKVGVTQTMDDVLTFNLDPHGATDPNEVAQWTIDLNARQITLTTNLNELFNYTYSEEQWTDVVNSERREVRGSASFKQNGQSFNLGFSLRLYNSGIYNAYVGLRRWPIRNSYKLDQQVDATTFTNADETVTTQIAINQQQFTITLPDYGTNTYTVADGDWQEQQVTGPDGELETLVQWVHPASDELIIEGDYYPDRNFAFIKIRTIEGVLHTSVYKKDGVLEPSSMNEIQETQLFYVHTDHLDTPTVITDQNRQIVWQADKKPFGEMTISTTAMDGGSAENAGSGSLPGNTGLQNNLRFPGQYFDEETGLHYNYFRDYDPSTGRYVQSDPIGLGGGINTYFYANVNPVMHIDPTGQVGLPGSGIPCFGIGCLPIEWPESIREPKCLKCSSLFYSCINGPLAGAALSCRNCVLSKGKDKLSCTDCANNATAGAACATEHCSWKKCDDDDDDHACLSSENSSNG